MSFVLGLATQNILEKTGAPFSAAIFNMDTNQLVSVGVNRAVPESCSTAHAQVMAICLAQKREGTYDFSSKGNYQMVTSSKMCIMCFGSVMWANLKEIVYSADTCDVESITDYDEGPVPGQYSEELRKRGINVVERVLQEKGRVVLQLFMKNGGLASIRQQALLNKQKKI